MKKNSRKLKQIQKSNVFTRGVINSVDYIEDALVKGGQLYRGLGRKGKIGVGITETAAVPTTGLFVAGSEESFPRSEGMRVLAETGGAIVPNIMLLKYAPILLEKLQKQVANKLGYKLVDHKLELYGIKKK